MSTALYTPLAERTGLSYGSVFGAPNGVVNGAYGYAEAVAAYTMKLAVEQTLFTTLIDIDAPFENKATTALFVPVAGMQGCASGIGGNPILAAMNGLFSYEQAVTAYGMKLIVEQTIPYLLIETDATGTPRGRAATTWDITIDTPATGTPRGQAAATAVVNVDPEATATPRGQAAATATIVVGTSATATGRVTAAVQAAIKWVATASATGRIVAAVTAPIRVVTSSTVMSRIIAAVTLAIRWIINSRGRVGSRRVRARDLSGVAILEQDQSGVAIPVRDESEGRPW